MIFDCIDQILFSAMQAQKMDILPGNAVAFLLEQLFFNLDYRKIENLQFEDNDYYYYVEAVPKRYRNDKDSQEMEAGRIDRKGREHHDGHETIHS